MMKGRPRGSSVSTGIERAEVPRFVRVKKRTTVAEKASDKKSGSNDQVADRRTNVVFVRKSAATLLGEAGGHGVKALSPTSSSMTGAHTTPGGKRHLAAALQREEGDLQGKTAKRTKVEGDTPVRNSRKGKRKRRRRGQKVVVALAKKDHLEEALSYLKAWHSQRETWSFRKKMQVCLLEHMYDSSRITKSRFATLLKYLEGLEGRGRAAEVQRAKQIVESYDCEHDSQQGMQSGDDGVRTEYTRKQYKRAVEVLRVLA